MKAAVIHGKNDIRVEEYPTPEAGPGEIIIKTKAASICATGIKALLDYPDPEQLPMVLGHEVVGEISDTGTGVTGYMLDDRVAVYPIAPCGKCSYCLRGYHNLCQDKVGLGHGLDGGFAEYVRLPSEIVNIGGVVKLPEEISFEDAVLAEPISCSLAAARVNRIEQGKTVLIIGAGSTGLIHTKIAKWSGCQVIISDLLKNRLAIAAQMGADHLINPDKTDLRDEVMRITEGRGADVVIITLGIPQIIEDNLKLTARGGVCNIFRCPPESEIKIDPRWLHYQEITLTGTFASTLNDFKNCLQLIREEAIIVSDLITHRFSLDEFPDAIDKAKSREMIRGVFTFGEMVTVSF